MNKSSLFLHFLYVGAMSVCLILNAIYLAQLKTANSFYLDAVCTLDTIHWIQDSREMMFVDKTSISNVTVNGETLQTFQYRIPQTCQLSKYVPMVASNCPGIGSQKQCWVRLNPLDVRYTLKGDAGFVVGIILSAMFLGAYVVYWLIWFWAKTDQRSWA